MARIRPPHSAPPLRRAPVQARARHTMAAILEATAQVVACEGEPGFNTNRIAERAGVSIGTLYQYFPDKQAILDHWIGQSCQAVEAEIDQGLAAARQRGADADEVARLAVHAVLQGFGGGDSATRALARLAWARDTADRIPLALSRVADRLGLRLQQAVGPAHSPISPEQVYIATRAVLGAIRFASLQSSPMLDSPAFEAGLARMCTAVLWPTDNLRPWN